MTHKRVLMLMVLVLGLSCQAISAQGKPEVAQPQPQPQPLPQPQSKPQSQPQPQSQSQPQPRNQPQPQQPQLQPQPQTQPAVAQNAPKPKLIVGVMQAPPYSMQNDDGTWSGITVDLWKEIAPSIGVDYEFRKFKKGFMGDLEDRTVDVAATGVSVTADREKKIDFSDSYLSVTEAVAVNADQQPSLLQVLRTTFVNWTLLTPILLILGLTMVGAAILWILEQKGDSEHYKGRSRKAFGESLFWSTMVLTGRELPKSTGWTTTPPTTLSGRVFGVIWMLVGIMLITLITASIASVLTSKQLQGLIHDPDDLRHVTVGTVSESVGYEYLKHRGIKPQVYPGTKKMLEALAAHKFDAAVFNRHMMVYYSRNQYLNKIVVLHIPLKQDFLALPLQAKSPWKEKINEALLDVIETKKWQDIVSNYLGNDWANAGSY